MGQCCSREGNGRSASQEVAPVYRTLYIYLGDVLTLYFIKIGFNIILTNQTGAVVTLQIFFLEVLNSNLNRGTGYSDRFIAVLLSLSRQMPEIVPQSNHHRFLPISSQFIVDQLAYHSTLYNLKYEYDSAVK
jgi:hypothetical protein